jgi:hypothetical protein
MWVSERDAAAIYAKAATKWYGPRARSVALATIQKLSRRGDVKGVKAWRQVCEELYSLKQPSVSQGSVPSPSICWPPCASSQIGTAAVAVEH